MGFNDIPAGKDIPNDMCVAIEIPPSTSPINDEIEREFDAIYVAIEIPANTCPIKYAIEQEFAAIFVDRFMATPMFYPANYGYVPNTLADDGDPLDVLVVTPYPVQPGSIIRARPIGILDMSDEAGRDSKGLAVA